MNTLGWVLILIAVLMARAVYKGRVMNMGQDLSDAFLALVSSDTAQLKEVLSRTGDSNTPSVADFSQWVDLSKQVAPAVAVGNGVGSMVDQMEAKMNSSLVLAAAILGSKAKGYRWAANGPDYYDCSGLMWQAMKLAHLYSGTRYNTDSFPKLAANNYYRVTGAAQLDDVVLWPLRVPYASGHMGVVTGTDKFYSARSIRTGLGESTISTFRSYQPIYFRHKYGSK